MPTKIKVSDKIKPNTSNDVTRLIASLRGVTTQHPLFKCTFCEYYEKISVNKS